MTVKKRKDRGDAWWYEFERRGVRYRRPCLVPATEGSAERRPARNVTEARAAEELAKGAARAGAAAARSIVRAGDFTLSIAQAQLVQRVLDRKRKKTHLANVILWGDEAIAFFGVDQAFQDLTQKRLDDYAAQLGRQTVKRWLGGRRRPSREDRANAELWRDTGRPLSRRQVNNYLRHVGRLLAIAAKVKDPVSRQPVLQQDPPLEIQLERVPRRKPRPLPDAELAARLVELPPWRRDLAWLSRLFGLRDSEGRRLEERHVDDDLRGLFFPGEETKSGHDEHVHGGVEGWALLQRLRRQARRRGTTFLVTWPGRHDGRDWYYPWSQGEKVPDAAWQRLTSQGRAWRRSAVRAGVAAPHRFHDVRARYITEVAKVSKAAAQGAGRHQSPAATDPYIGVANDEVAQAVARAVRRRPRFPAGGRRLKVIK